MENILRGKIRFIINEHEKSLEHNPGNSAQILIDLARRIDYVERNVPTSLEREELLAEIEAGKEYLKQQTDQD